jgi:hypothetical protein
MTFFKELKKEQNEKDGPGINWELPNFPQPDEI